VCDLQGDQRHADPARNLSVNENRFLWAPACVIANFILTNFAKTDLMLRKKLLLVLSSLVLLMLGTALSAVLLMGGILVDLEDINSVSMIATTTTSKMSESILDIETQLTSRLDSGELDTAQLEYETGLLRSQILEISGFYEQRLPDQAPCQNLEEALNALEGEIAALGTASPVDLPLQRAKALEAVRLMRQEILWQTDFAIDLMKNEQKSVTARFRWTAIGLAGIFVLLINISIVVLLRAASFVLKPVDRLVEASRHLAREEYDYRVAVGANDEFAEMGNAFNNLAENLEANEQRKIETLHQVARTMSHELNNAIAIIDLQLNMVARSSGNDPTSAKQLKLIHETLRRMNETIIALTKVRRVVLTDYIKGVKMLDLKRSTEVETKTGTDPDSAIAVHGP
jgi:signal transduction histidine kinase